MTLFSAIQAASVAGPSPAHPLAVCPPRVAWVVVLISLLAILGWSAEQIGALLLFFAPAPHAQVHQ